MRPERVFDKLILSKWWMLLYLLLEDNLITSGIFLLRALLAMQVTLGTNRLKGCFR